MWRASLPGWIKAAENKD